MQNKQDANTREPYSSPQLRIHGNLGQITQNTGRSGKTDGSTITSHKHTR